MNINKKQIKDLQELNAGFDHNDTFVLAQSGSGNFPARKIRLSNIGSGGSGLPCEIVDTLTETTPGKALDATMGKVLNDTKLDKSDPIYTGHMASNGSMSIDGKIWSEEEVGSQNILAESYLTLGPDAIIRYISGFSGGSPIYNTIEPEDIMVKNGTNYLMVYGIGTPAENGAELLAAYEAAKKMPRHLGTFNSGQSIEIYKGQTFVNSAVPVKYMVANSNYSGTIGAAPIGTFSGRDLQSELDAALARRVSVIVAPGEYELPVNPMWAADGYRLVLDLSGVDIVSLTGNPDVKINGVFVNADIFVRGIDTGSNQFVVNSVNATIEDCISNSTFNFGRPGGNNYSAYRRCKSTGLAFFGIVNTARCYDCEGGAGSFKDEFDNVSGILENCKTTGTFPTPTGAGKLYNCIDGDGNLINYPALVADVAIPTNANLPGSPTTTTQPSSTSDTKIATTAFANAVSSVAVITDNRGGITYSEFYAKEFLYVVSNQNNFELNIAGTAPAGTKIIFKALPGTTFTKPLSTPSGGTVDGQDTDTATFGNDYTLTSAELIKGVTLIHRGGNDWITLK